MKYLIISESKEHWQATIQSLLDNKFVFNQERNKTIKDILSGPYKWPNHPNLLIGNVKKETDCKMLVYNTSGQLFDFSHYNDIIVISIERFLIDVLPTW